MITHEIYKFIASCKAVDVIYNFKKYM